MGCSNSKLDEDQEEKLKNLKLPENIYEASKSITKVEISSKIYTGFLLKLFKEDKDFFCLILNKECINKDMIERNEKIKFNYDNEKKSKEINLNEKERYIKNFSNIGIDLIVIEIIPKDEIEKKYFLFP